MILIMRDLTPITISIKFVGSRAKCNTVNEFVTRSTPVLDYLNLFQLLRQIKHARPARKVMAAVSLQT